MVHGMSADWTAAHKLQLLLMMMLMHWMRRGRMRRVRQLLGAAEGMTPRTLGHITLKCLVLYAVAGDTGGTAASRRCGMRLHIPCLGAEATQDARAETRRLLQTATVARLAIANIARLLQYNMAIVRSAIVDFQHSGERMRPDQVNDGDQHAGNKAKNA